MEQIVTSLAQGSSVANSLLKPVIIPGVTLMTPGVWTGTDQHPTEFTAEEIERGFESSDWENMNLFLDHKDVNRSAVDSWVGFVRNVNLSSGELKGDLEIWHPMIGMFIKQAKAKFAVSASMNGAEGLNTQTGNYSYKIDSFRSMSLVDDPGCKNSWLPKSLSSGLEGDKKVTCGSSEAKMNAVEDTTNPEGINSLADEGSNLQDNSPNHNCKEVEKMEKENQKKESKEEKQEKSLAAEKETKDEDVKNLSSKIDKLVEVVAGISETVKSLAADKESTEEESKEEEKKEEETKVEETKEETKTEETTEKPEAKEEKAEESTEELDEAKKELAETKKELAALKEEANSPDQKTLAGAPSAADVSVGDANVAMLGFLREKGNIPIY